MKQFFFFFALLVIANTVKSQVYQEGIGGPHSTATFISVKYDPNNGGTINAGYVYDSAKSNDRDWFLVKLDKNQNIVWQKVISNQGDDFIYKVIVCANGDYVAVGVLTQSSTPRGFICRINSSNGKIVWSSATNNSSLGEIFYDVVETSNKNIVIAGTDKWVSGNPDAFIISLDSLGNKVWSEISQYGAPDQPYSINQLPNGNLIIGINEWAGGHYNLIMMELKETNGKILNENTYSINTTIPGPGTYLNSLAAWGINVKDKDVTLYCYAFAGSSGYSSLCIYDYNKVSKKLSGNVYYHTNNMNAISFTYTPLGKNDYLITESYTNPDAVYVSRVTNGYVVYDDLVKGAVTSIRSIDTTGSGAVYSGSADVRKHNNTYDLFASRTNPVTNASCHITNARALNLFASSIIAAETSDINFVPGGSFTDVALTYKTSRYQPTVICGTELVTDASANTIAAQQQKLFSIYPNPATNNIYLNIPFNHASAVVSIYDVQGSKKVEQKLRADISSKDIDISKLAPGVYEIILIQNTYKFFAKFVKK